MWLPEDGHDFQVDITVRNSELLGCSEEAATMKALLMSVVVTLMLAGAVSLSAHHSWPVDTSKLVTVKGTVTEFAWENPHPMITLEVRTDDGKVEKWSVGG